MKKNYVLAFVLSMSILVFWEVFVLKPRRQAAETAAVPAAATVPSANGTADAPAAPRGPARERDIAFDFGENRITFNHFGAAVAQWEILEKGQWVALVPPRPGASQPLATFPELEFDLRRRDNAVVGRAKRADGLTVEKTFTIDPTGHLQRVALTVSNSGKAAVNADHEVGWGPGVEAQDEAAQKSRATAGTQRAIAWEPPRLLHYKKASTQSGAYKWWAVDGHYFLAAFLNEPAAPITLRVDKDESFYSVHRPVPLVLEPKQSVTENLTFYLGPKGYEDLKKLGLDLERSVDFGFFAPVGHVIHKSLLVFHRATRNYGWAIILLTLIIQLLVLPLTVTSFRHSQKMKTIQPQLKRLQELYKSDPQRLNVEMLALYQRHGLRFMGMEGCLPVLIQLPIFWALFSTLRSTYELRHAPWIGWVKDLSVHDPYYVLPVLMGGGMFLQQKMSAAALDPNQRQIMYIMPIMFTFFFLKMPAGLVVYWLTSSVISVAVQMVLLRLHAQPEAAR